MADDFIEPPNTIVNIIQAHLHNLNHYATIYKPLHTHPELSILEHAYAATITKHLSKLGYEVHNNIGGIGIAALLPNGPGPTMLLRAGLDALSLLETTVLPYASTARQVDTDGIENPVALACGHDMHMTSLLAAAELLLSARSLARHSATNIQRDEKGSNGARAMIDDRLYSAHQIPRPDLCLAQHLFPLPAGSVATRSGPSLAEERSFTITLFGKGGHGAEPQKCIDPGLLAAYIVVRLQSIVRRGVDPEDTCVVTFGSIHAGGAGEG